MTEAVDVRSGQLIEDSFAAMLNEDPVDHDAVMDGITTEGEEVEGEEDKIEDAVEGERPTDDAAGANEGTDQVLARLESSDPAAYKTVRSMQQEMSKMHNEWHELRDSTLDARQQLLDRMESLNGSKEGADKTAEADSGLPEGVTQDHLDTFKAMAEYYGYVPRAELESRDVRDAATDYTQNMLKKGVEEFGDEFGSIGDDGMVVLKPEIQSRLATRLENLVDETKGITPYELFVLEYGRPPTKAEVPRRSSRPSVSPKVNVNRRAPGELAPVKIYDRSRGDTAEDALDRAFTLTRRELGV
jgi:hypothetical protein